MNKETQRTRIEASAGRIPCDRVLRHAQVVDVFSGEILPRDVAIKDGYIVGFGEAYVGHVEEDLQGQYLVPALMDAHIHIESTLVTPKEFSKAALPHGVTAVVMDPHEIANVLGREGIRYMLDASENLPVDFYAMLSSCVPATALETSGAVLRADDLRDFLDEDRVLGLAEVMDLQAVKDVEPDMARKLRDTLSRKLVVDGHGSGLSAMDNNVYRTAGISTDHECTTREEAMDRLSKGFYIHIREGSVAKNFEALIPLVNSANHRRFTFCTDDIHISDLAENGSIDLMVRRAIEEGLTPVEALRMATLNPAECYRLHDRGAVAPGYQADLLVLSDLQTFTIEKVYKDGELLVDHGATLFDFGNHQEPLAKNTVKLPPLTLADLEFPLSSDAVNVIRIHPNSLLTDHEVVPVSGPRFQSDVQRDLMKILVQERHGNSGTCGKGVVTGFGMIKGAVATTIAHDSHNIVAMGVEDGDLLLAMERLAVIGGGIVLVDDGKVRAELALPLAGLMSQEPLEDISQALHHLHATAKDFFNDLTFNPFLTLSFLTLPVIPELKITDRGLFATATGDFIPVSAARD